ncbi:unnamed protein product [Rotaria sp. Silwood1]|nr:unnamed protein product [Rotaria sp. Silwood1]CAF1659675.1 unnamed protein product [Rotaria sp. Silwood1]
MTAGSISAPSIIPLRVGYTQKSSIDTNTLIAIRSDTNDVDIYYTLDGSKPDAFITLATRQSMRRSTINSLVQENPTNYTYSNSQIQTNVLRCAHCFAPKSNDLYTRFCTECGLPWQKLTHNPPDNYSPNICTNCKSTIPFNSNTCVVCETPVSKEPQQRRTSQNQVSKKLIKF